MSQPTIYWFGGTGMTADRYGFRGNRMEDSQGYIRFTDYAALAAENERLRKAGDAMAESINFDDQRSWEDWGNQGKSLLRDCVIDWITAKREADAS